MLQTLQSFNFVRESPGNTPHFPSFKQDWLRSKPSAVKRPRTKIMLLCSLSWKLNAWIAVISISSAFFIFLFFLSSLASNHSWLSSSTWVNYAMGTIMLGLGSGSLQRFTPRKEPVTGQPTIWMHHLWALRRATLHELSNPRPLGLWDSGFNHLN